jgi:hypothetical protein
MLDRASAARCRRRTAVVIVSGLALIAAITPAITHSATPGPSITSFSPTVGRPGTPVLITGQNFVHMEDVEFNGTSAAVVVVLSSTRIRAVVDYGTTTGPIEVMTDYGTATSTGVFTVRPRRR